MKLHDEVRINLEKIKATKGVENVVLTQRDGNPIQYSGVWLSKDEIFSVTAATSAIYNCGLQLHQDRLKYILIEGQKAKILLSPLRNYGNPTLNKIIEAQGLQGNDNEFFVAITTQPTSNLGGIFLKTRQALIEIKKSLILSGESFKPPLRKFTEERIKDMFESIPVKDDLNQSETLQLFSMNISENTYNRLNDCINDFSRQTLDLIQTYITIDGGFVAASHSNTHNEDLFLLDAEASMGYALFSTSDKCAWLLKKMHVNSILLECTNSFQFINRVSDGIFSAKIAKGRQKLGLLRLIIPRYVKKFSSIIKEARQEIKQETHTMDFKNMFSELVF